MKRWKAMGLVAGIVALAGCAGSPFPAYQSPDMPVQVSMTDWALQQELKVTRVTPERVGAGQLKVSIEVYNSTNSDVPMDYKFWFLDKSGTPIEDKTGWQYAKVPPRGFQSFNFTSITPADDFRVQLRPAERIGRVE